MIDDPVARTLLFALAGLAVAAAGALTVRQIRSFVPDEMHTRAVITSVIFVVVALALALMMVFAADALVRESAG